MSDPARRRGATSATADRRKASAPAAIQRAKNYLEELTGKTAESVSGLERTEDGWSITVEAVELERVPSTTDILASYRIELDENGELLSYERVSRYFRNQA